MSPLFLKKLVLLTLILFLGFNANAQIKKDSTASAKIRLTNFEYGINMNWLNRGATSGTGFGLYIEPKYVSQKRQEFGMLIAYNHFEQFYWERPEYKHGDDKVVTLLATIKGRSLGKVFGLYFGLGGGIALNKIGGLIIDYEESENPISIRPSFLFDFGIYIGGINLGLKFLGYPTLNSKQNNHISTGLNLGLRF